jgi:hypothetical protein
MLWRKRRIKFGKGHADLILKIERCRRMQPVQDQSEPTAGCHPSAAGHADMEARGGVEIPIMQDAPLCAAGAPDQADRDPGDHALQMGASGRGAVRPAEAELIEMRENE